MLRRSDRLAVSWSQSAKIKKISMIFENDARCACIPDDPEENLVSRWIPGRSKPEKMPIWRTGDLDVPWQSNPGV
jgi:hypothetical protein